MNKHAFISTVIFKTPHISKLSNCNNSTPKMIFKLLLIISVVYLGNEKVLAATDKIICYYASWATYRPTNGKFDPEDIDANLCTHVNYAFLGLEEDGHLKVLDEDFDINEKGLQRVSDLKKINPNLKVLLSLGGWTAGTATFTAISADATKRTTMANSAIDFMQTYGFDGLDVDWEYPQGGDKENYITLLTALKQAFEPHGYMLTVAVAALPGDAGYDVPAMSKVLDVINVMTYDFHGSWAGITAQNSPLYANSKEGEWQKDNLNANSSITHWIESGADPQKLAIGAGFYGHSFMLSDGNNNGVGAPSSGAAEKGPYTQNVGTLGYNEICEFHSNGTVVFDNEQMVPYIYDGLLWVGFDNPQSLKTKAQYAIDKNLAGVMVWSIETGDPRGVCGEKNPLLKALNEVL